MSSPYPVLGDRPIDQWKVTELKEELKRRKLPLRGLKDDLIKRLDEALRLEMESAKEDVDSDIPSGPEPEVEAMDAVTTPVVETVKSMDHGERIDVAKDDNVVETVLDAATDIDHGGSTEETMAIKVVQGGINERFSATQQEKGQEGEVIGDPDSLRVVKESIVHTDSVDTINKVSEGAVSEVGLSVQDSEIQNEKSEVGLGVQESQDTGIQNEKSEVGLGVQELQDTEIQKVNGPSQSQMGNEDSEVQLENQDLEPQIGSDDPKPLHVDSKPLHEDSKPRHKDLKPLREDSMPKSSIPNKQVPEVTPILGIQVKTDSNSSDSMSINQKNELKDDIIADNVKLELDNVKPDLVQPQSSNVIQDGGDIHPMDAIQDGADIHPMDVEESDENKFPSEDLREHEFSIQEIVNNNVNADTSNKNDSAGLVYPEKLNLDRSSGDDSMEEDVLDGKQIDSKYNSDEVGDGNEKPNATVVKEEGFVDIVGDDSSTGEKTVQAGGKLSPAAPVVKRKLHDQEAEGNNEFPKRQRRWNSEFLNVPEPKNTNLTPTTTPKGTVQPKVLRRNLSRSDSVLSDDTPKERVVPPSPKSPTNSLRIDRFLRPFTLKAVQELLAKTGTVNSFWMDHIKTHCYVTYSSVEEAVETRNAVYDLQWPTNGGRLLVADFVDPQEVKKRVDAPQAPAPPVNVVPTSVPQHQPQPSPHNQVPKQQLPLPPPPSLPPPPPFQRELPLPPPPPLPEKQDLPILTLDDLFKKTKATPRIYYLPLSEEQVAAKRAVLAQNTKQ